jgi:plastocyanin
MDVMAKAKKKSSSSRKYSSHHEEHNFLIIVAGGFVVLILIFLASGNMFFNSNVDKTQAQTVVPSEERVAITGDSVAPETVIVKKGTTVTWTNDDNTVHTIAADDDSFNTGNLYKGESGSVTFDRVGTFTYHDQFNPQIRGSIVVE